MISIRAPLAGSDNDEIVIAAHVVISIRAPLAGSDNLTRKSALSTRDFNPRSPCGERPVRIRLPAYFARISIRAPLAGSDLAIVVRSLGTSNFNPRSPCGERLGVERLCRLVLKFQSALPLRGATLPQLERPADRPISIRAPLAGSDRYIL